MKRSLMAICAVFFMATAMMLPALGNSISGIVYQDPDKNGKMEANETGLANVTVELGGPVLCLNDKGLFVEPDVYSQNTTTNETGYYKFDTEKFGRYFLKVATPELVSVYPAAIDIANPDDVVDINMTEM